MYDAGTVTKNGIEVPVKVDTDGQWRAQVGEDQLIAATKAELVKKIDRVTKKVSQTVSIPFTSVQLSQRHDGRVNRQVRQGVATGIHSGNSNILVLWTDNGERAQVDRWSNGGRDKFVPLTPDEADEYTRLYVAQVKAQRAVSEWEQAHKINLRQEVTAALEAAASKE